MNNGTYQRALIGFRINGVYCYEFVGVVQRDDVGSKSGTHGFLKAETKISFP